ncbi:hypothetical protein AD952_03060 [Acetobacter cerevisiae]|uniref:Uncharacterized protein n=2 Tax=Acetobacter TaxID=434 RepID=A0A149ULZ7_9PROT|nr:hypothetical protein AD951_09030 [Acetobacter malorum]KXV72585.1 hypothetical protein AD952_03060 [Acetobacter cerevisiae]
MNVTKNFFLNKTGLKTGREASVFEASLQKVAFFCRFVRGACFMSLLLSNKAAFIFDQEHS